MYSKNRARVIVASLILLLATSLPARSQSRGDARASLRVTVFDESGAAVANASVLIIPDSGEKRRRNTNPRGEALFEQLPAGKYRVRIEAAGFEPGESEQMALKSGITEIEARLEVARVREQMQVSRDEQERRTDPRGNAFANVLTADQISALPDDPDELEAAIRSLAGPDAMMRVNGFRGGRLPPKSQIREIRFRLNSYAAENHEASHMAVDIYTKPGIPEWHGTLALGFRDESLAARNASAPVRGSEQFRRTSFSFDGPAWRNHTSLFFSGDSSISYDSKTVVAALPDGVFSDVLQRPSRTLNLSARFEHLLTGSHTLRGEYQRNAIRRENLGAGDFNLAERAYTFDQAENVLRLSDTGLLGKHFFNELRFQTRWNDVAIDPLTQAPATIVLSAFSAGGAQIESRRNSTEIEIYDGVDFSSGKHAMKAGVLAEIGSFDNTNRANFGGTFIFPSLEAYRLRQPTTFTIRTGDPRVSFDTAQVGWFWQDDIRLRKNLLLSIGVRHELQTHVNDWNNFAPRAAASWSPSRDGKTTIRAGAGVFYDWFNTETFEQTLVVDGRRQSDVVIRNPGFPNPQGIGFAEVLPPSRIERDPSMRLPYIAGGSLSVERQLPGKFQIRANYSYQRGVHLLRGHNINAPFAGFGRPDPSVGNVNRVESTANSWRHSLFLSLDRQFSPRLFFSTSYLHSRWTDEADGALSQPADNFDLRGERGPAAGEIRHRAFVVANLGLWKGLRLGTLFTASSGLPYTITTGFDENGDTVSNDRPAAIGRNSARGAAQYNVNARLSWGIGFGKRESPGTPRAQVRILRPGESDVLGSLGSIPGSTNDRYRTEFYVQAFNLFNHSNLVNFSGVRTSPFFGVATAALPPRRIEAGLRFTF